MIAMRTVAGVGTAVAAAQLAPVATSIGPLRRAVTPRLNGVSPRDHVALTYDDGPDAVSTPQFLDLLAEHRVRATFFLLGEHVVQVPALVREMADTGHELAVHGWSHRCLVGLRPGRLVDQLRRSRDAVEDLTGRPVTWYRPPYGVLTGEGILAARSVGLEPMLWSAWGQDWTRRATADSIRRTVTRRLRAGGTVLLHDTDRTSAPGSWLRTLAASRCLLEDWTRYDVPVGPLAEHW